MAQRLKRLPAMQEAWVRSLGREDTLEKEMATHSSVLAWRIPWAEKPGGLQSMGRKESDTAELASTTKICPQPSYQLSTHKTGGLKGLLPLQAKP